MKLGRRVIRHINFTLPRRIDGRWIKLPVLGGLIAGDLAAYRYLNRTDELFARTDLVAMLQTAGFTAAKRIPLTFGVATIYIGRKASH